MPSLKKVNFLLSVALLFIAIFPLLPRTTKNTNEDLTLAASNLAKACTNINNDKGKCYKESFVKLTEEKDFAFSVKTLALLQDMDPFTKSCHVIAHHIARTETLKNLSLWKELLNQVDVNSCGGGYPHGVLEAHFAQEPDFKISKDTINEICSLGTPDKQRMCAHMFGHLLLVQSAGEINPSLETCKLAEDRHWYNCLMGVFMEDHQKLALAEHALASEPKYDQNYGNTLIKQCKSYKDLEGVACWEEMGEIFAKINNYEQSKIYNNCLLATNNKERKECYLKGVVVMATHPVLYDTPLQLTSICQPYQDNQQDYSLCTSYLISALMEYSPKFANRGIALCANTKDKQSCFEMLGNKLKSKVATLPERQELCKDAPEEYLDTCAKI